MRRQRRGKIEGKAEPCAIHHILVFCGRLSCRTKTKKRKVHHACILCRWFGCVRGCVHGSNLLFLHSREANPLSTHWRLRHLEIHRIRQLAPVLAEIGALKQGSPKQYDDTTFFCAIFCVQPRRIFLIGCKRRAGSLCIPMTLRVFGAPRVPRALTSTA